MMMKSWKKKLFVTVPENEIIFLQETMSSEKKIEILYSSRGFFNASQVNFFKMDLQNADYLFHPKLQSNRILI